jgi:hypothetical protein
LNTATVPKSARISMIARATPATTAGLAMGRATRRNAPRGLKPRLRAASITLRPWAMKAARASMYT